MNVVTVQPPSAAVTPRRVIPQDPSLCGRRQHMPTHTHAHQPHVVCELRPPPDPTATAWRTPNRPPLLSPPPPPPRCLHQRGDPPHTTDITSGSTHPRPKTLGHDINSPRPTPCSATPCCWRRPETPSLHTQSAPADICELRDQHRPCCCRHLQPFTSRDAQQCRQAGETSAARSLTPTVATQWHHRRCWSSSHTEQLLAGRLRCDAAKPLKQKPEHANSRCLPLTAAARLPREAKRAIREQRAEHVRACRRQQQQALCFDSAGSAHTAGLEQQQSFRGSRHNGISKR
jgi:hypothetical protein